MEPSGRVPDANPMHRSHEHLVKIAIETLDGVLIHQILGKLKPGDIPADVRSRAINKLVEGYFVKDTCVVSGYPMDMRYAGPREALLHALFRQNFGCSHLIIGRDHAGVGDYYGPFDAQKIFDEIPRHSLEIQPLKIDWTFFCYKCDGMASMKTCPHGKDDRVLLSGTKLRKMMSEGEAVPPPGVQPARGRRDPEGVLRLSRGEGRDQAPQAYGSRRLGGRGAKSFVCREGR